jgi:hypothetical protein
MCTLGGPANGKMLNIGLPGFGDPVYGYWRVVEQ